MFSFFNIANAASDVATKNQPNLITSFLPLIFVVVIFYFFIIKPQQKKQKEFNQMLDNLKVGDKISTVGGIIAEIAEIDNAKSTIKIKANSNVELLMHKKAIAEVFAKN